MIQRLNMFVSLAACITVTILAEVSVESDNYLEPPTPPSTTRNIFKPPNESKISEIEDSHTPWVKSEHIPAIQEFKKNIFIDLRASSQILKNWYFATDSKTTRDVLFKLLNKFLTDIGHPNPADLANIVSKSASLFDILTMPVFFETDAIHVAKFLLSHNIEIERDASQKYISSKSDALARSELNNVESIWRALLGGYVHFIQSYGFKVVEIIDELLEGLASELIVMHDNMNEKHDTGTGYAKKEDL